MRGVELCSQTRLAYSDAARKMASAKGHSKLRTDFHAVSQVDAVFAQGLSFLGQLTEIVLTEIV